MVVWEFEVEVKGDTETEGDADGEPCPGGMSVMIVKLPSTRSVGIAALASGKK